MTSFSAKTIEFEGRGTKNVVHKRGNRNACKIVSLITIHLLFTLKNASEEIKKIFENE